jgi:Protein of unknown function (DUF3307)
MLLTKWICAHLLGDFLFQNKKMVQHKQRFKAKSWMLYVHCLIHGALFYLFNAEWSQWHWAAIVAVTHFFIDWWKLERSNKAIYFVLDQAMHVAVLIIIWFVASMNYDAFKYWLYELMNDEKLWPVLMGYFLLTWPFSMLIGLSTQKWRFEAMKGFEHQKNSLADAGRWIGIFERLLVYTFIISNNFAGIGLLITAKSILRFNDTKGADGKKEAEYILIGTLMSFAVAIVTGLLILKVIE